MVGDEFDRAVLRNHNRQAVRVLAAEAIGCSVPGSSVFHGLQDAILRFDIEGAIHHFVFKTRDLNLNAKSEESEFVVEQAGNRRPP